MFIVSLNYKKEISEVEKYLKEHVEKNEIAEYEFIEFIPTKFDEKFAYFVNN